MPHTRRGGTPQGMIDDMRLGIADHLGWAVAVTATDSGEPGTGDTFTIDVAGAVGDAQSGTLGGGNIQVRGQTCLP